MLFIATAVASLFRMESVAICDQKGFGENSFPHIPVRGEKDKCIRTKCRVKYCPPLGVGKGVRGCGNGTQMERILHQEIDSSSIIEPTKK